MTISHNNNRYAVECLKYCKTLDGVRIYCFKNIAPLLNHNYIVAVKSRENLTLSFTFFPDIKSSVIDYLENVCRYA